MSITLEEVRHVARLARLNLDESEIVSFQGELNALLGHFGDIQVIEDGEVEPTSHAVAIQNVWSDDQTFPTLSRSEALKNAPLSRAGLFVVPAIIED